jgi:hypothetical protein
MFQKEGPHRTYKQANSPSWRLGSFGGNLLAFMLAFGRDTGFSVLVTDKVAVLTYWWLARAQTARFMHIEEATRRSDKKGSTRNTRKPRSPDSAEGKKAFVVRFGHGPAGKLLYIVGALKSVRAKEKVRLSSAQKELKLSSLRIANTGKNGEVEKKLER